VQTTANKTKDSSAKSSLLLRQLLKGEKEMKYFLP
jgi:hypothetical protein